MRGVIKAAAIVLVAVLLVWLWQARAPLFVPAPASGVSGEAGRGSGGFRILDDEVEPGEGVGEDLDGAPQPPRAVPGSPLWVELTEPPATHYGTHGATESDRHYEALARELGGLRYVPALGHAARELAAFHALEGKLAPDPVLTFLLDAGGASEWGVEQMIRVTSAEGDEPIVAQLERVAESVRRGEHARVGVGETWTLARPPRRHVAVLVSRGELLLDRAPREVRAHRTAEISGLLPPGTARLQVLSMGPDLVVEDVEAEVRGRRFSVAVPTGPGPGALAVELIAGGPGGPKPLAQLDLHVDEPVPETLETRWPPDEAAITTVEAAEAAAWGLINADRDTYGLDPLRRDAGLDAVARGHSLDMREGGFFGHVSPTTGSVTDRLRSAGIRTVVHAENIARNDTLFDAEVGLMRSIGHRRNILHTDVTRVGVGVAAAERNGKRQWTLTQVFGRPSPVIDGPEARVRVLRALQDARRDAGVRPLSEDDALDDIAETESFARRPTPQGALDRAGRALRRGGWAWVARVHEVTGLEVPEDVLDARYRRVGLAVRQDLGRDGPDVVIVLVVGG